MDMSLKSLTAVFLLYTKYEKVTLLGLVLSAGLKVDKAVLSKLWGKSL